jgi:hypothetical protein
MRQRRRTRVSGQQLCPVVPNLGRGGTTTDHLSAAPPPAIPFARQLDCF